MDQRLNKNDHRLVLGCILISAIFCFIAVKYFYKAFPEASIDFKTTRVQSRVIGNDFLIKQDIKTDSFTHCTIFDYDDYTKIFLERELGLDSANKIMGSNVRLWRWNNRYFKPLQKEEFTVAVTTKGEIVGFEHLIKEEQEGAELTEVEARGIAEQYIRTQIGKEPIELQFLTAKSEKRPHRLDWTFTWKAFDIKDAEYRMEIVVQGNEIGAYKEFLKIPEKWTREYEKLRSLNHTAGSVSTIFFVLIFLGMLFVFMKNVSQKNIKWKLTAIFGLIAFVLIVLASFNALPLTLFYYETTASYAGFLGESVLSIIIGALVMGVIFIAFITASSEPVYRENYRDKISLSNLFKWRGIRSKQFFRSMIVGLTLAFFFIGYQVIFYIVAKKFGAWSPADVPYSDMLNTKIPAIFALLVGFEPAVSEEFMFRMFAIAFCKRIFKSNWLAIIIPAFIWGFLHSSYPQQPFYIRGMEVGLAGILIGILMLKFDILAVLVFHYTIDAFYTALLLLRSHNSYFVISGALAAGIMVIPLIICIICYIKNKGFVSSDELLNEREKIVPKVEPVEKIEAQPIIYKAVGLRRILIWGIIACIFLCSFSLKPEKFGDSIIYKVSKKDSRLKADEFIKSRGIEVKEYKTVTFTEQEFDDYAGKYIMDRQGIKELNNIYGKIIKPVTWCTRYFKPLEEEEYKVYVEPEGKIYTFEHIIAEADSGAELSKDSVLIIGTKFLESRGINLDEYELKEVNPEKRKARLDYTIIWEAQKGIEEAKLRLKLTIQGNEVAKFEQFTKIPEEWKRERKKTTGFDITRRALTATFFIAIIGLALWLLIIKARQILWKKVLIISAFLAGLQLLSRINNLPLLYKNYPTSIGLTSFTTTSMAGMFMTVIGIFILGAMCIGLLTVLYPESFKVFSRKSLALLGKDTIMWGLIGSCIAIGITCIDNFLFYKFPQLSTVPAPSLPEHIDTAIPFISYLAGNIIFILRTLTCVGVGIYVITHYIRKPLYVVLIGLLLLIGFTGGKTLSETTFSYALVVLGMGIVATLVKWGFKNNILAYLLSFWVIKFGGDFYTLYTKSVYTIDTIILFILAIFPVLWILLVGRSQELGAKQ